MRVATSYIASQATMDFQRAQIELFNAQRQAGSERKADDLKGYEREANELISARGLLERADSYVTTGAEILNRLDIQDVALSRASQAGEELRLALTNAIGLEQGSQVMADVELAFSNVLGAMETNYAGKYVFGGVREDASPVNISSLNELEAALVVDDIFENAPRRPAAQIDPQTRIEVAPLADEVSRDIFDVLKRIKEYETANGPFGNPLTPAQRAFLETEITNLDVVNEALTEHQALNGGVHQRAESLINRQKDERDYFEGVVGDVQSVDLAEVATRLSQAQTQLEASARVFTVLSQSTLLNFI